MGDLTTIDPHIMARQTWGQVALDAMSKLNANDQRNLLVAQGMPKYYEAARNGRIFVKSFDDAGTSQAPLAATPLIGVNATWTLYNDNSAASGIYLIPIHISYLLDSGTAAIGNAIAIQVPKGDQDRVSADASGVLTSCSNGSNAIGSAYLAQGETSIGAQSSWITFSSHSDAAGAVHGGAAGSADINGIVVIPPHGAMAIEVFGGVGTTALYNIGVVYIETAADNA